MQHSPSPDWPDVHSLKVHSTILKLQVVQLKFDACLAHGSPHISTVLVLPLFAPLSRKRCQCSSCSVSKPAQRSGYCLSRLEQDKFPCRPAACMLALEYSWTLLARMYRSRSKGSKYLPTLTRKGQVPCSLYSQSTARLLYMAR